MHTTRPKPLHFCTDGQESAAFTASKYRGVVKREEVQAQNPKVNWHVAMMPSMRRLLDTERFGDRLTEQLEKVKAFIRAKTPRETRFDAKGFLGAEVRR